MNVLPTEHCLTCGAEMKVIAAIFEQPVVDKILAHLGLQAGRRLVGRPGAKHCKRLDDSYQRLDRWVMVALSRPQSDEECV